LAFSSRSVEYRFSGSTLFLNLSSLTRNETANPPHTPVFGSARLECGFAIFL
jgi:hypothetical protein